MRTEAEFNSSGESPGSASDTYGATPIGLFENDVAGPPIKSYEDEKSRRLWITSARYTQEQINELSANSGKPMSIIMI